MDEFRFEGSGMEDLARDIRDSADRFQVEVDKTVAMVGAEVKELAKGLAGKHSKSIPATIKLRMVPGAAVITAGSEKVALAVLYELGNKKGKRSSDTFNHPVFGNWYSATPPEKRYPFLRPALAANRKGITMQMESAWRKALGPLRLE